MNAWKLKKANAIFVHIPKTAGKSMKKFFDISEKEDFISEDELPNYSLERSFAFVRHPLDRLASGLRFLIKYGNITIKDCPKIIDTLLDDSIPIRGNTIKIHLLPQTHPFFRIGAIAKIGTFETLDKDFKDICNWLGYDYGKGLEVVNSTGNSGWKDTIPPEYVDQFIEIYRDDFIQLGYT